MWCRIYFILFWANCNKPKALIFTASLSIKIFFESLKCIRYFFSAFQSRFQSNSLFLWSKDTKSNKYLRSSKFNRQFRKHVNKSKINWVYVLKSCNSSFYYIGLRASLKNLLFLTIPQLEIMNWIFFLLSLTYSIWGIWFTSPNCPTDPLIKSICKDSPTRKTRCR